MKLLMVFLLMFLFASVINAQGDAESNSGRTAPNFKLESIEREFIELNDFVGKGPVLLCFWSSCCKSAVMQVEAFSSLYEKYKDKDFVILAIATDDEKTVAKVKPFVMIKKYSFPVLYDTEGTVARMYYAYDMPFYVLIDNQGNIVYSHLGYMKGDEILLDEKIGNLLSQ
ncbi:MAG TPA: TlpA disulfide reductase family protein [Ignavibacteriaceae bacterium]|nr:TlpA disulfide reductase family protein [Ignavibacteriaceae bacterium]